MSKIHQLAAAFQMKMHTLGRTGDLDAIAQAVEEFVKGCVGEEKAKDYLAGVSFPPAPAKLQEMQHTPESTKECTGVGDQVTDTPEQTSTQPQEAEDETQECVENEWATEEETQKCIENEKAAEDEIQECTENGSEAEDEVGGTTNKRLRVRVKRIPGLGPKLVVAVRRGS